LSPINKVNATLIEWHRIYQSIGLQYKKILLAYCFYFHKILHPIILFYYLKD
jgi:hypothetical protein